MFSKFIVVSAFLLCQRAEVSSLFFTERMCSFLLCSVVRVRSVADDARYFIQPTPWFSFGIFCLGVLIMLLNFRCVLNVVLVFCIFSGRKFCIYYLRSEDNLLLLAFKWRMQTYLYDNVENIKDPIGFLYSIKYMAN